MRAPLTSPRIDLTGEALVMSASATARGPLRMLSVLAAAVPVGPLLGPRDPVVTQLGHQGAPRHPEEQRRARLVGRAGLERVDDPLSLGRLLGIRQRREALAQGARLGR